MYILIQVVVMTVTKEFTLVIDRYWFFITDTDTYYLYVYVPDNRYAEPIFIGIYYILD